MDNETLAAYVHWFKIEAKRCNFNSDTTTIWIFIKGLWDAYITAQICKKDPQTLSEVMKLAKKFNTAQQVTAILTSSTVNMMSNDDWCFVCRKTGHIGHYCPDVQSYNCKEFRHFAQDCPDIISLLGIPHHHNRSCSQPCYKHNHRDRHSYGRCSDWSWSHHWSYHSRTSHNYRRHASCSPSNLHSSLCYPSTNWHPRQHSCQDMPHWCTHNSSRTCHFSHWNHFKLFNKLKPLQF